MEHDVGERTANVNSDPPHARASSPAIVFRV
jgi:hypothetical protein